MIKDQLGRAELYYSCHPRFKAAFEALRSIDWTKESFGKHVIDGDKVYVSLSETPLNPWEGGKWEAHRKYIDIQYVVSGANLMGSAPIESLEPETEYEAERDFLILNGDGDRLTVKAGEFAVFFPTDAHKPGKLPEGVPAGSHAIMAIAKVLVD